MTEEILTVSDEYMAGMVDGEGSIQPKLISKPKYKDYVYQAVHLYVTNTHLGVLEAIQNTYGGKVRSTGDAYRKRMGWKRCYVWNTAGRNATAILKRIEPFLIIKHDLAIEALSIHQGRVGGKPSQPRPQSYTRDFREMVIGAYKYVRDGKRWNENGGGYDTVAEQFNIGSNTVRRWVKSAEAQ